MARHLAPARKLLPAPEALLPPLALRCLRSALLPAHIRFAIKTRAYDNESVAAGSYLFFYELFLSFPARNGLPPPLHRSGKEITELFVRINRWEEIVERHFEYAGEKHLLKVAQMHQAAFDLGDLAAINVPTGKLQLHRQVGLAPTEAVSPSHNFRANEVLILHAAACGISNTGSGFRRCARLGAT